MAFVSQIGPLELSILSTFAALFLYRVQARRETRIATGLVFLCAAQFGASFINGFAISQSTKFSFGQLDTVFAYLMLAFAFLEILLLQSGTKLENRENWVVIGLLGLGVLNLLWRLSAGFGLSAKDFLYSLLVLLFLALRPTRVDLRFLPYFGATIVLLVFISALAKYQNPYFPYGQLDYGLGSAYQNRIWFFFGWEERFRGPYYHPNQLGIQVTFLSSLVLLSPKKLYLLIIPISFILLFLASSRTSILALIVGITLRLFFDWTGVREERLSKVNHINSAVQLRKPSNLRKVVFGLLTVFAIALVARQIIGTNRTGSGRLQNYNSILLGVRENLLFGQGPSLYSINSTENTLLTILSYFGLLGLGFFLTTAIALALNFRKTAQDERSSFHIVSSIFLVASSGEALLTGSSGDTGLYYLLILLSLTRSSYLIRKSP
jgi:hypothetical protein